MALKKSIIVIIVILLMISCWHATPRFIKQTSNVRFGELDTAIAHKKIFLNTTYFGYTEHDDSSQCCIQMTFFDDGLAFAGIRDIECETYCGGEFGIYKIEGDTIYANTYSVKGALFPYLFETVESITKHKFKIINKDSLLLTYRMYFYSNSSYYEYPYTTFIRIPRDTLRPYKFSWFEERWYKHLKQKRYLRPKNDKVPFEIKKTHYVR